MILIRVMVATTVYCAFIGMQLLSIALLLSKVKEMRKAPDRLNQSVKQERVQREIFIQLLFTHYGRDNKVVSGQQL